MFDFLFRDALAVLDPEVHELIRLEAERQYRKLILIPSESCTPVAVREALGSVFQNLYAEGYPNEEMRWMEENEILNYPARLVNYRRYSGRRFYKGVEYVDIVESLARRRCAQAFATPQVTADELYVNVQPLSGAPANNAVYHALVNPGDTVMGMNLLHGGHLTHGSPANRSGKLYHVVSYSVDPETEQINYETVSALAQEHKPKIIIAGYSSYPWMPDWARFRAIADSVGAVLLADISHIAGLVIAGVVPTPVGHAHVITFTTHKTLFGPRGACILCQDGALARKIDRAVFPGEQGGPHVNAIAGMAVIFKLAGTERFRQTQWQIVKNCRVLTDRLKERGLRIPFGGTDTHLGNLDCKSIVGPQGATLSGDQAARILDIAGIVLNPNAIPGDKSAMNASGIRYGTPWVTERGLKETEMIQVADIMADVLQAITPYSMESRKGGDLRAKVDFRILEEAKLRVRALAEMAGIDYQVDLHGYPHFYYLDDQPVAKGKWVCYDLKGHSVRIFANWVFSSEVEALETGQSQPTQIVTPGGPVQGFLTCVSMDTYRLTVPAEQATLVATWLRDLSDGYVAFDEDIARRLPGPIVISEVEVPIDTSAKGNPVAGSKPYYVGIQTGHGASLPEFTWEEPPSNGLLRTPLNAVHRQMGAKMVPFAGWEMPVWYSSVMEEHLATRRAAGLFDVSHMGVYQVEGVDAVLFLNCVCANDISLLAVGESCYTHFLDVDANVIDDLLVYRRAVDQYLVVVNASNDLKDWTWLNAVHQGKVMVDRQRPYARAFGRKAILRNLRDPKEGADMRVDLALQGPASREILLKLGCDVATRQRIMRLRRTELCEATVGGFDLVVSRTGYTGEGMAFELFVHPSQLVDLWRMLLAQGESLGLKPCGLGARDSLRTEAGLPLYGHEMGAPLGLGVGEAGFGAYVKVYKPWFIGRQAYLERERARQVEVVRFRFNEKGVRMAHLGDPVLDRKGRMIGKVTSCAIDSEGFLTGQAVVERKSAEEGTLILIYQGAPKLTGKPAAELEPGDRVILPTPATILSRFLKPG